ncbi:MAG: hypothetical protein MUE97_00420, partial [Phycisphaerales bacterium]|nr:hypothetical protein [Phycisphaerales bacterium]
YGGPVPVTTGNPSHLGNPVGQIGSDLIPELMNGVVFFNGTRYFVGPMDRAILRDCGVTPRCLADIAGANQQQAPDTQLSADDIIVYLSRYFAANPMADIAGANQSAVPDGQLTADDIIVFLGWYFAGC